MVHSLEFPQGIDEWIHYDASLTDKLELLSGDAKVELLSQRWSLPQWWDIHQLNINEQIFEREIFMKSYGQIFWYARTVLPKSCYDLDPTFFNRLEKESIRHLIFNEAKVERINRSTYPIDKHCLEFYWIKKYSAHIPDSFAVRCTHLLFQKTKNFYLIEILFPTLQRFS